MVTKLSSSFMSDFKLHKNITFNISIMKILRKHRDDGDEGRRRFLQKPLIVFNVSMIEALLYDFHKRIKWNTREGVAGLPMVVIDYIRRKQIDKLETLIASSKKHDLFGTAGSTFYDDLDQLRRIRNRMHIQNEKNDFEADDHKAFSEDRLILSERALEWVILTLEDKYSRPENTYTAAFELPWDTYFP
ncbi:hypothetical protein LHFGNBLO_000353 [Mesorhizobium sp. AR10]|uniref:hypothetical protein n=1 Tax=Mesorhizobium sp. AR10 TaxID=2865839 RepID=UPI00215E07C8|nr:hypothetical protein [Mesorhizobium sp. AR10]UVK39039.1 hypothetical protein LHFGNBLO_000353 [Mesorhizobium sp. AR10]